MSDKQQKALEAYNNALRYGIDCMAAIASIGGDPATVSELVAAYNDAASALAYIKTTHGALYGVGWERLAATARAVLAKLPENSNEG